MRHTISGRLKFEKSEKVRNSCQSRFLKDRFDPFDKWWQYNKDNTSYHFKAYQELLQHSKGDQALDEGWLQGRLFYF